IGLLGEAVDADLVLPRAMEIARAIAAAAPIAVRMTKRSLYRGLGWDVRAAAQQEAFAQAATVATDDVREGIQALLDKREPRFQGR
ncbi:MAG TPA: enoyl-CoA hydratase-related protein, partial [Kofleriaceae bacterium]|nr:enoyl-CoA hydratase-related protein [Kofleriaceae bacterium]